MTENHDHDHEHDHVHNNEDRDPDELREEQSEIAREIGADLTDAFVGYVRGEIDFDDLVFGVFDALSDLNVVASGEYVIEEENDNGETDDDA